MKYCITYKKSSRTAIEQAEELLIQYNEKKDFLECLLQYPQKRIIIAFDNINLNEEILKQNKIISEENAIRIVGKCDLKGVVNVYSMDGGNVYSESVLLNDMVIELSKGIYLV